MKYFCYISLLFYTIGLADQLDQINGEENLASWSGISYGRWEGQTFTPDFPTLTAVEFYGLSDGHPWNTMPDGSIITAQIWATSDGLPNSLLASSSRTVPLVLGPSAWVWNGRFEFDPPVNVKAYLSYTASLAVIFVVNNSQTTGEITTAWSDDTYTSGTYLLSTDRGAVWNKRADWDLVFRTFGIPGWSSIPPPAIPENCGDPCTIYLNADLNKDCNVNFDDLAFLVNKWLSDDCITPMWCDGADFDQMGNVNLIDYTLFSKEWSKNTEPQNIPLGFRTLGTKVPADAENIPIPLDFTERSLATNTVLPSLTQEEIQRGYVVFKKNYLEPVYPRTRPLRQEITTQLTAFCSLGEYEPITFSVHALAALENVEISASDLKMSDGNTIDNLNIDIRSVRCMPRRVWNQPAYIIRPTLIEKRPEIDIEPNKTQQYWLTVYVPPDTLPGNYTATIYIQPDDRPQFSLNLQLNVLPVTLQSPSTRQGMYYTPANFLTGNPLEPLPATRIRRDVLNMKEHGMNTLFMAIPPLQPTGQDSGGIWIDLAPIEPMMQACIEAGFPYIIYNTTIDELIFNPLGSFAAMLAIFLNEFNTRGWPIPVLSAGDESDVNGSLAAVQEWLSIIKQTQPQRTTYSTIVLPANSEVLEPYLDVRAFSSYMDNTVVALTRAAGKQLWQYSGTSGYGLDPKGDRLYRGFWAAKLTLDGAMDWVYFQPSDWMQPFNDLCVAGGRPNMDCWILPADDGPLPSPGWEAIREGADDGKYVFTLAELIQQAYSSNDPYLMGLAADAQACLDQIYAQIDTSPAQGQFPISRTSNALNAEFFDSSRWDVAQHIIILNTAISSQE